LREGLNGGSKGRIALQKPSSSRSPTIGLALFEQSPTGAAAAVTLRIITILSSSSSFATTYATSIAAAAHFWWRSKLLSGNFCICVFALLIGRHHVAPQQLGPRQRVQEMAPVVPRSWQRQVAPAAALTTAATTATT
jgi:hypothetical protein